MQPYRESIESAYSDLNMLEEDLRIADLFIKRNVRAGLSHVKRGLIEDVIKAMAALLESEHEDSNTDDFSEVLAENIESGDALAICQDLSESFCGTRKYYDGIIEDGGAREFEKD